jgi:predicted enzyme related to lactoylglutathione lyase
MQAAKEFYGGIFGWQTVDQDTQGGPPYAEFRLEGQGAAGLGQMSDEMKAQGIPPMWNSYVNVDDVEKATKKAQELGAQVTVPVMKVVEAGWLSFIQDPTGGHLGLWQKNQLLGAQVVSEPGSFCWNELATRDIETARAFYSQLLDWELLPFQGGPTKYYIAKNKGKEAAGLMQMDEQWGNIPPHWMVYFSVSDTDATVERITQAGGKVHVPPFDIPVGRMAVVADPEGGVFSLIRLARPPA